MKRDFYYPSADQRTSIHAIEWLPEGEIRGVLQICHGMVEYIDRYHDFASFMTDQGFYVTGNDHLGHGKSVVKEELLGFFHETDGNRFMIEDIRTLHQKTMERFPSVPYFMLGHSMGSFLLRQYIIFFGADLSGAIIMGTAEQSRVVLSAAKNLSRFLEKNKGTTYRSTLLDNMAIGVYNKKTGQNRTSRDWLTRDENVVDRYISDPLCSYTFTVNAYYNMFCGIEYMQKKENIARIPKDLPLLLVSGAKDPVGSFGKGVQRAYRSYQKAGIRDLQMKLYPDDRHEVLNELDRDGVYLDLLEWIQNHMNGTESS